MKDTDSNSATQRGIPCASAVRRGGAALLLALVAASCPGCHRGSRSALPAPVPSDAVCILVPAVSNALTAASQAILALAFPGARTITMEEGEPALERCRERHDVLIVPQVRDLPTAFWTPLTNHLAAGGAVVFWGNDPLALRYEAGAAGWTPGSDFVQGLAAAALPAPGLAGVQSWRHFAGDGGRGGPMRVDLTESVPWPAVVMQVTNLVSSDAVVLEDIAEGAVPTQETSLAFFVRADERTSRLAVECDEADGSRWAWLAPVSLRWSLAAVHEAEFFHEWGGTQRGGPGDHLDFSQVRRISIGFSMPLAPQAPGAHTFGLSNLRTFRDPRPSGTVADWPDIPLLSPPYRYYDLQPAQLFVIGTDDRVKVPGARLQSPLARPSGLGGDRGAPYRWIPLAQAENSAGELLGWPASLYVEPSPGQPSRQWAWIGLDPGVPEYADVTRQLLQIAAARLYVGRYLLKAGADHYVFKAGEQFTLTARAVRGAVEPSPVRITSELLDDRNLAVRRVTAVVSAEDAAGGRPIDVSLGAVPRVRGRAQDMTVRLSLWDAADRRQWDVVEQAIRVLPMDEPAGAMEERLAVAGPGFMQGRRPVILFGINYWPLGTNGRRPGEYNPHWLDAGVFDLDLIRRDLNRLQEAGMNAVAIQYLEENQAPQLRMFLDEIRARNMWVLLFVNDLSPFAQDLDRARRLIAAADLPRQPNVFAFDLAWEPRLGMEADRQRLDSDWRAWLLEQFGSFDHASRVLGRPLWQRDGQICGPPDAELTVDEGEHRVAVATYRRFVDDWVSQRYGDLRRFLAAEGCPQLLTVRSGFGGSGNRWADPYVPIDLASGAIHLDFLCPEAWGLAGDSDAIAEAGFLTAYARGVSGGKPVVWLEYGLSVGEHPMPLDLANQARVYDRTLDLFVHSHAAGSFAWWYPSGYRVEERSDMGVVRPDGAWRPAGEILRGFNQRLRRNDSVPMPWRGRELSRSAHARGLSGLWDEWRAIYRQEMQHGTMEEIRPAGFGKFSRELPLVAVGGAPYDAPAPLEYLNAEWGEIRVNGVLAPRRPGEAVPMRVRETVAAELLNTGPATWSASVEGQSGAVWVTARREQGKEQRLTVRVVPYGDRLVITWTPSDAGRWTLRPWLAGAGSFGESLVVEVRDDAP